VTQPLLTAEQVGERLGIRAGLVRALAHDGSLAYVRIGAKLMRFREQDVEAYVAAHLLTAKPQRR
jgi:excisionase family DNA binding protein